MRRKLFLPLLGFCISLLLFSCEKEFSSNADYKDVTIAYGVLNADEPINYVKIYKGYLVEGNAYETAQEFDSLYYFDKIDVCLEEYVNGNKRAEWALDTTTQILKESGTFSEKQLLYQITRPLQSDATYKLRITNKESGRVIMANTNIVGDFAIQQPNVPSLNIANSTQNPFQFTQPQNGAAYEIYEYFYWIERDKRTLETTEKSIKMKINSGILTTTQLTYVPYNIVSAIVANVYPNDQVERYLKMDSCIRFEVWAVNQEILKYTQTTTLTSSVVTDRLVYSNVLCDDGLTTGIFGSTRATERWYALTPASEEELINGERTRSLGFRPFYELK